MGRQMRDPMGVMEVPDDVYYGAQTARALQNFRISGLRPHPELIRAIAQIKRAAAIANAKLGRLSPERATAIAQAADEVCQGDFSDSFPVDVFTAGAGTSIHMNVNEVIAGRASEILTGSRDRHDAVHPNDHVNLGQSTNDVFPSAMRISAGTELKTLEDAVRDLADALAERAGEFDGIVKSGRTHLQDAAPIRLGQEFQAYATSARRWADRMRDAGLGLRELGLGGSAVGTGLNTDEAYIDLALAVLETAYETSFRRAPDLVEAMQSQAPIVETSGVVRGFAGDLLRITGDLRLLASGPRTGLAEIRIPAVQPGSSIMPGKVNPVIPEMTAMVCYQVFGCDLAVAMASSAGQLELNVMMPVIAFNLLLGLETLARAVVTLDRSCIRGIEADPDRCNRYASESVALATVLTPLLGYDASAAIVHTAVREGRPLREVIEESGRLTREQVAAVFDLRRWTEPGVLD